MVQKLGDTASEAGKNNVAFMANFVLGNLEECLEILIRTNRLPEAAFFARTYLPSEIARVLPLWKTELVWAVCCFEKFKFVLKSKWLNRHSISNY